MNFLAFLPYLCTMAVVTYLCRALPLLLLKTPIRNRFLLSFLHYIPYAVLTVMTVPACLFATGNMISAAAGTAVAVLLALKKHGLLTVAAGASGGALIAELMIRYLIPLL